MRNSLSLSLSHSLLICAQIHTQTHRDEDDENDDENDERERFLRFSLMMSKNSSSNDNNNTHQQKRIQTDDSIFATRESLRLVRQQSEGRETHEEETVQRMRVRRGGAGRTIQTTTTMRVKEHKAKTRTNDSSNRRKMIPQREEQHSRTTRSASCC